MPIKDKQAQGAAYTNVVRTEALDEKIKQAIHTCKQRGLKEIDSGNLGEVRLEHEHILQAQRCCFQLD